MSEMRTSSITHRGPIFSVEVIEFTDARGRQVRRDIVRHPGAVTIVAEDDSGNLVMIRNYRVSAGRALLEFPAGKIEPDEPPLDTARRELEEETGFTASRWREIGRFYTSPGMSDELMHVFHAADLQRGAQRLEPGEEIDVEIVAAADLLQQAGGGRIEDGKTLAALLLITQRPEGENETQTETAESGGPNTNRGEPGPRMETDVHRGLDEVRA